MTTSAATIQDCYAVVQKAAGWVDDFNQFMACINEFHMLQASDDVLAEVGMAAHRNGISPFVMDALDI